MAVQKSEITRERVLTATALLFARKGYLSTSMRDVAANLGMKSGSLYYYYDSKEALLAAVLSQKIEQTLKSLEASIASLPSAASVRSQFRAAARENLKIIVNDGDMAVASARTMSLIAEPAYTELVLQRRKYNLFWRRLLVSGKKSGEIKSAISEAYADMFIIGAMSFVTDWYDPKRSSIDDVADYFTKLFFDGIKTSKKAEKPVPPQVNGTVGKKPAAGKSSVDRN